MTNQEARYDAIADGYAEWWAPIHLPGTLALLDEMAPDVETGARRILDVGCGTGALAVAAVRRWPHIEVDAIDASSGMLRIAQRHASSLTRAERDRLALTQALADRLPFDEAVFDLGVSAFVLQLVPSRYRALCEIRRVLRPGGRIRYVTWLRAEERFAADTVYDEVRLEIGLEPRWDDDDESSSDTDDIASPGAAVAQLRRAGFAEAQAHGSVLVHRFTPEGYVGFIAQFDDADEIAELEEDRREALERMLLERLQRLPADRLRLTMPVVYATGIRRR